MVVVEWIIWAVAFLFSLSLVWGIRRDAKRGRPVHVVLLVCTVLVLLSVIAFAFFPWGKLHLLWVVPACVVSALVVGFIVIPVPIIGDILRDVCLLFAHALLVGTR